MVRIVLRIRGLSRQAGTLGRGRTLHQRKSTLTAVRDGVRLHSSDVYTEVRDGLRLNSSDVYPEVRDEVLLHSFDIYSEV